MTSPEGAAVQILKRAVELDKEEKYGEALACYEQGIRLLMQASKGKQMYPKELQLFYTILSWL